MFITIDYPASLAQIAIEHTLFALEIIPGQLPPIAHSPYRPEYDWLFTTERRIARELEPWLKPYRFELIGEKGILCEALANAFCHGHRKRYDLPIAITAILGKNGVLVSITDQGQGFDVDDVLKRVATGQPYYHIAGNGMDRLAQSVNFQVFFDQGGRRCNILHFFKETKQFKPNTARC